jgi:uncharacterized protein (DUF885 family)
MGIINEIADRYVDKHCALDPVMATECGIAGFDGQMTDLSPEGFAARAELDQATAAELRRAAADGDAEQIARSAMLERLEVAGEHYDSGDETSDLNVVDCWLQRVRQVFDLMPVEGDQAQRDLAARMAAVPAAYAGLRETYLQSAQRGRVGAVRQVIACAKQCEEWSAPGSDFYSALVERTGATGALRADLDKAARAAATATADIGEFLRTTLRPLAPQRDAVGREHYARASKNFLGATVDLDEAYAWGWSEVHRIQAEMRQVARQIVPAGTIADAAAALEADPARKIHGRDQLRAWMQACADQAVAELNGRHFEIPERAQRVECLIAPTSGGGMYYTAPSEDWSRPGRIWWAIPDSMNDFSTWQEVTTIYHEGVPGHHLQGAQTLLMKDELNRWQRLLSFVSGQGEGWALYAERLMDELGYLQDPGNRLGMLDAQLLRSARVVVDIGVHLELTVPADSAWRPGERWNADIAWEFLRALVQTEDESLRYELDRYLGWPGQAPSYKLGERFWLQAREDARARKGSDFSLKDFHMKALSLGSMGLEPLREALARL